MNCVADTLMVISEISGMLELLNPPCICLRSERMFWGLIASHPLYPLISVHVEDIIFHMFQYIQKLRTEGPQEWVFQECKVGQIAIYSLAIWLRYWLTNFLENMIIN